MALPDLNKQEENGYKLTQLFNMQNLLNAFVIKNLQSIGKSPHAIIESFINPNLFKIAVQYYGDPTLWYVIAQANQLTDPYYTGIYSLLIPPKPANSNGGILMPT